MLTFTPCNKQIPQNFSQRVGIVFTLLLLGFLLPGKAQAFIAKEQLVVFDSTDVKVGKVLGLANNKGEPLWVAFTIEGHLVALRVTRNRLQGPENVRAYFLESDCSGLPHFKRKRVHEGSGMFPTVLVGPPGLTVYVVDEDELSIMFYPQSARRGNGACESLNLVNPLKLLPAKSLVNFKDYFTPPFTLR